MRHLLRVVLLFGFIVSFFARSGEPATPEAVRKEAKELAQPKVEPPKPPPAPKELFPIPAFTEAMNNIKKIPVGPTKVSFGLEHRTRVEIWDNKFLPGNVTYSKGFVMFRNRPWMDWDLHKNVRLFVMGQDARKEGDEEFVGRVEEDKAELLEAFLDIRVPVEHDISLRIGRQALIYGKQRLVGTLDWINPGRRFDAVKASWKSKDKQWMADIFASKVAVSDAIRFNRSHPTEEFYGLYATNKTLKQHSFDLYFLARVNDNARTKNVVAGEVETGLILDELGRRGDLKIYTPGFRAWGDKLFGHLDYEVEGALQFGSLGKGDHNAGAMHAEAGWTFAPKWLPRLMAEFNYGTGDRDPDDGDNENFNNLFHSNHPHQGFIDNMAWTNSNSVGLGFTAQPVASVTVWAKAFDFFLASKKAPWFGAPGAPLGRDRTGNSGRHVAWEVDIGAKAVLNRHIELEAGYSIFEGGEFVNKTRLGDHGETSQFLYVQAGLKF